MKKSVCEIITEKIISKLEDAMVKGEAAPWQKPWRTKRNYISKRSYSGINLILLPDDETEFITWTQFSKLRETNPSIIVKKGHQKHLVVKWIFPEDKEGKTKGYGYPIYYKVMALNDILGIERKEENPEFKSCNRAEEILDCVVPTPDICHGGSKASYAPAFDVINVPPKKQFYSSNEYYSTLFHELVHWTGHESRCNRNIKNLFGNHAYSKEELVAEIRSAMLLAECGIHEERVTDNQVAYLSSWLKALKSDIKFIWEASSKAQKAIQYILGEEVVKQEEPEEKVKTSIAH